MKYHARFWGVPCVFDEHRDELRGTTFLADILIRFYAVPLAYALERVCAVLFNEYEPGFSIKLFECIEEDDDGQNET